MGKKKEPKDISDITSPEFRTQDAYETYLTGLAFRLVEQRLLDGTATSQETTHFLRLGSMREKRQAKLEETQIKLMEAKVEAIETQKRIEALYEDAIKAATSYGSPVTMGGPDLHE